MDLIIHHPNKARPCRKCGHIFSGIRCKECQKEYNAIHSVHLISVSIAWNKNNQEKVRVNQMAWSAAHPEAGKLASHKRRALMRNAGGRTSEGLSAKLFALQKGRCACCKKPLGKKFHMDHITPLARGGLNSDENIQLLTPTCNHQKHAKDPIVFMQSKGFLI